MTELKVQRCVLYHNIAIDPQMYWQLTEPIRTILSRISLHSYVHETTPNSSRYPNLTQATKYRLFVNESQDAIETKHQTECTVTVDVCLSPNPGIREDTIHSFCAQSNQWSNVQVISASYLTISLVEESSLCAELEFSIHASTLDRLRHVALVPYLRAQLSESGSLSDSGVSGGMAGSQAMPAVQVWCRIEWSVFTRG